MNAPQQLSQKAIDDFKAIYQKEFKKVLSDDDAQEMAIRVLRFFAILCRPLPGNAKIEPFSP